MTIGGAQVEHAEMLQTYHKGLTGVIQSLVQFSLLRMQRCECAVRVTRGEMVATVEGFDGAVVPHIHIGCNLHVPC
eukprot:CAMPEP_0182590512 /NCGR_PEP_ID=MMETSP1324-20130603/71833_1 /TAXON_ID=236786 /ORGANISM="Florenciella sp., Strain RCC1587" /LENGTH=75 /DNA_ID=CAMNT_0024807737 /DNA_START=118 /DNA_END=345 /DNA_ORIENTATION=-